jgi:DNA-binding transcriptional ArsR family regulator
MPAGCTDVTMESGVVDRTELAPAAALFRSLGDPARLAIVRQLAAGPARVVDLVETLGLAQSTVSKHLACMRDCGLVASEPVGRASLFRLAEPALLDVLAAAETVLAATGATIALCPTYEGAQNLICAYLAAAVLIGLLANTGLGWWWLDPVVAMGIAGLDVWEGVESWRGENCC